MTALRGLPPAAPRPRRHRLSLIDTGPLAQEQQGTRAYYTVIPTAFEELRSALNLGEAIAPLPGADGAGYFTVLPTEVAICRAACLAYGPTPVIDAAPGPAQSP